MEHPIIQTIQNIMYSNNIPVHRIVLPCNDLNYIDLGLRRELLNINGFTETLNQWFLQLELNHIYFLTDIFQCSYITLKIPDSSEWFLCGPILFEQMHEKRFLELFHDLKFPVELREKLQDYYQRIAFLPSQLFLESIFREMGNILYGKENCEIIYTDGNALDVWYYRYNNYLRIPDKPFHNIQIIESRYELENNLIHAVCSGNEASALELLAKLRSMILPQRLPDRLRDQKDYTITLNTLLRKATEQAGVHPIHIDCCSNSNIKLIEELSSISQCYTFQGKMVRSYCELIHKHSLQNYSSIVAKVLTYIHTDLRADLGLNVLAEYLSVNASYLSTLFKKEVGITLTDYVNQSRIALAQKLLLTTDMPIKSVAQQCGIPDVYYFTRLFKRSTGTTPKAFRDTTPHESRIDLTKLQNPVKSQAI